MTRPPPTAGYDVHGAYIMGRFPCASKKLLSLHIALDNGAGCSSRLIPPILLVLPFCDSLGPDPDSESTWHVEIRLQYTHDKAPFPLHTGYSMYAEASLRKIMINFEPFAFGRSPLQPLTFHEFAAIKMDFDSLRIASLGPL